MVPVVHVCYVEVVFCSLIRRPEFHGLEQCSSCLSRFYVETVVTNESENFPVAIYAVVPEHLSGGDDTRSTALVGDVLYKVCVACHNNFDSSYCYDCKGNDFLQNAR